MRERAEGRDDRTGRIHRDDKQDERREARRDEMMWGRNYRPLANLPTCQLANLPTCHYTLCRAILTMPFHGLGD